MPTYMYAIVHAVTLSKKPQRSSTVQEHHLLLLHKQAHDKLALLHAYKNRARLTVCEVGIYLREVSTLKNTSTTPLPYPLLVFCIIIRPCIAGYHKEYVITDILTTVFAIRSLHGVLQQSIQVALGLGVMSLMIRNNAFCFALCLTFSVAK